MLSNNKIPAIIIIVLIALFSAAAWYGYTKLSESVLDPIQIFPDETALILEIPNFQEFQNILHAENEFWADLIEINEIKELNLLTDKIQALSIKDEKINAFFNNSAYLTCLNTTENKTVFLLVTKQNKLNLKTLEEELFSALEDYEYTAPNQTNSYASLQSKSGLIYIEEFKGLFLISNDLATIEISKNQLLNEKAFISSNDFLRLKSTRGKRANAYIYINYNNADKALAKQRTAKTKSSVQESSFANFGVFDIILKKEELLLNGYTTAYDSLNQYLSSFQNQQGKKTELANSFPYSTESFIAFNLSDYRTFIEKQINLANYQNEKASIDKIIHANSHEITEQWWAGEMALLIDDKQNKYAVFSAKSGRETFRLLADIAHQTQPRIITEIYREQKIKEINSSAFLKSQFGSLFSDFKEVYFCVIDEAVIFSKSQTEIKSYIDALILGNNLSKNESYIEFSDNLSDDAIIRVYSKTLKSSHPIYDYFNIDTKALYSKFQRLIEHSKGIGIQISNKNDLFYTGLIINHGTTSVEKASAWQTDLEAPIAAGPFVVKNHNTQASSILVQDEFNILYFINSKGDIVWSQTLKEKIISDVISVDLYKNGKWQYLFNSLNYLYLIDINGNSINDYPIKLNSEATNGLQVLDYDRNKEYRILIAGKNGELYNYELSGRLLKGWKAENTRKEISKPISHLVANKKDYIIAEADNGNIIMTDRRGNKRMEIRKAFTNALGSDIYVNRTNSSKGVMLSTDTEGNLVYIPEQGPISKTSFGKMSAEHFFLYADLDKNTEMDFIYLDGKSLRVYDKFKKVLLSHDFNNPIALKPQLFESNNKVYLGIVDPIEKQLYIFDKDGLIQDKTRKGNSQFVSAKLEKTSSPSILIGFDNSIFNYPFD